MGWGLLFPEQVDLTREMIDIWRMEWAAKARAEKLELEANPVIESFYICDSLLKNYSNKHAVPMPGACTVMACREDKPCCNGCSVSWVIEGTDKVIHFSQQHPAPKCHINECGVSNCPKTGFWIYQLRAEVCPPDPNIVPERR